MLLPIIRSDRKQFTLARQKNWSVNLEHKEPSFIKLELLLLFLFLLLIADFLPTLLLAMPIKPCRVW